MMSSFSRRSIAKHLNFYLFRHIRNLHDLAHYVGQRAVFNHTIVQDEIIGGSIREYSLFVIKFYSYIYSDAFDGLVLS